MIAPAELASIKGLVNLVDLVGRHVRLTRKGRVYWGQCPFHKDKSPSFKVENERAHYHCFGCGAHGDAIDWLQKVERLTFPEAVQRLSGGGGTSEFPTLKATSQAVTTGAAKPHLDDHARSNKARALWNARKPGTGSPAEVYLRCRRGYSGPIPSTLGFLPPLKPEHHPAMIAMFGLSADDIAGVHLTFLRPDGSNKADVKPNKIMIGAVKGSPIVLAPPNDLLGLAFAEGIEDGLSVHRATGLGVWAAGSAGFMPALADIVPDYIEAISIYAHPDEAGQRGAHYLAERLRARQHDADIAVLDLEGGA